MAKAFYPKLSTENIDYSKKLEYESTMGRSSRKLTISDPVTPKDLSNFIGKYKMYLPKKFHWLQRHLWKWEDLQPEMPPIILENSLTVQRVEMGTLTVEAEFPI